MRTLLFAMTCVAFVLTPMVGAAQDKPLKGKHTVKVDTNLGSFELELDADKAPLSVANFLAYTKAGFYNGTVFHRVIPGFMIQGGGFTKAMDKKSEGLGKGIKNEWKNGLKNTRGTVAMARLGGQPDSATAQFFINVVDNAFLDQAQGDGAAYAVFGKVVKGMGVVDKIKSTPCIAHPKYSAGGAVTPKVAVVIKKVALVKAKKGKKKGKK